MAAAGDGTNEGDTAGDVVLDTVTLGFPWTTLDPFLVTVHHVDHYPAGDGDLSPATSVGRRDGDTDPSTPGWSMYHGTGVPGFPQHPHRGFETVTFVRKGIIDHSDSLGATARYGAGDVQWLTAGRGVQHAEMFPLLDEDGPNTLELFQIWLNLPAVDKMADPHFTMFWAEDLPTTVLKDDAGHRTEVTVVAGAFGDVEPLPAPPESWASRDETDVAIWQFQAQPSARWSLPPVRGADTVRMLYVYEGAVEIDGRTLEAPVGALLRADLPAVVVTGPDGAAALVLQGRPIDEPVAMGGPFVMNTRTEIETAYRDYRETGFGGWSWPTGDPVHTRTTPRFAHRPDGRTEYPEGPAS